MAHLVRLVQRRAFTVARQQVHHDLQMPTPLSLGHGIQYRKTENSNEESKGLAVVVGWMGAKDAQLKSYLSFYHAQGFDTLSFAVGPMHVLFPGMAKSHMEKVLDTAIDATNPKDGKKNPKDIIYHAFSMGGYLFGISLNCMQQQQEKFGALPDRIKAQIFDSPPDKEAIPTGIAKSAGGGPAVEKIVEGIANTYIKLTASTSGVQHAASSNSFHNNFLPAPSLWFYSRADPVARWEDCELVVSKWREGGKYVETCTWEDTPHIQHGRIYPERYFSTLHAFLANKCGIVAPIDEDSSKASTAAARSSGAAETAAKEEQALRQ